MKNKKKLLVVLACLALCVCTVVTGTLAWLTTKTETITNTFTTSDINIELTESDTLDLQMIPGGTITKDPKVTVKAGSEDCWLFVKIDEVNDFANFMAYSVPTGWTLVPGETDVYYRVVSSSDSNQEFAILGAGSTTVDSKVYSWAESQVLVLPSVTKADMNAIDGIDGNGATGTDAANAEIAARPTLTFTAYAIQQLGFNDTAKTELQNATAAWNEVRTLG